MKLSNIIGEDWFNKLEPFFKSEDWTEIQRFVAKELKKVNSELIPSIEKVMDDFTFCPYKELKVVFLAESFLPVHYDRFYEGIEAEIYELNLNQIQDIKHLSEQGMLFLPLSLTQSLAENKIIDHSKVWKPFIDNIVNTLLNYNSGLIYILCGKEAQKYMEIIADSQNYIIPCTHPKDAEHFAQTWDAGGTFKLTNLILKANNNVEIQW